MQSGHGKLLPLKRLFTVLFLACAVLFAISAVAAWTGPTANPPGNNVAAPVNVGAVDQVKNGGLGVNSLAVFGNSLLGGSAGSNAYLNFGATSGTGGYGIRDNAGTLEFKNNGGDWAPLAGSSESNKSVVHSVTFRVVTQNVNNNPPSGGVAYCPAGMQAISGSCTSLSGAIEIQNTVVGPNYYGCLYDRDRGSYYDYPNTAIQVQAVCVSVQ